MSVSVANPRSDMRIRRAFQLDASPRLVQAEEDYLE